MKRPRIAFVTVGNARSRSAWSGTLYYIASALDRHLGDVSHLEPVDLSKRILARRSNSSVN